MHALTDVMVFLPYTPRADAEVRGYDDWLRQVDNPFFNAVPGIVHYSNWKALQPFAPFSHFDFMYLDPARAETVWTNPDVIAFAEGWTAQWGRDPDAVDQSLNYHSYRLGRVSGESLFDRRGVQLITGISPAPKFGGATWRVTEAMLGVPLAPVFEFVFGPVATLSSSAFAGTLIAAPDE